MTLSILAGEDIGARVAALVESFGKAPAGPATDLRANGFSSLDLVNLMLAVEECFDLQIPSARMTPANFRSVNAICDLVRSLVPA